MEVRRADFSVMNSGVENTSMLRGLGRSTVLTIFMVPGRAVNHIDAVRQQNGLVNVVGDKYDRFLHGLPQTRDPLVDLRPVECVQRAEPARPAGTPPGQLARF